jgi:NNP family nitrate/nitrite transporter-like MFS transporter
MLAISWRGVLLVLGLGSILAGTVYARVGSGGNFFGQKPDMVSLRRLTGKGSFWGIMALFALGVGSTIGIYTMLPVFLVEDAGMTRSSANLLVGFSRAATLVSVLAGGWASDRYGSKQTMGVILFLTGILTTFIGVFHGRWNILAIFLQSLVAVCFFPSAFAAMSSVVEKEFRNIIISLTVPFSFLIGGGLFPVAIGALGDLGHFRLAFSLTGAIIAFGGIFALLFLSNEKSVN